MKINTYNYYGRRLSYRGSKEKLNLAKKVFPAVKLKKSDIKKLISYVSVSKIPCILEVGFGMGDNLRYMLANEKKSLFIGCEPYLSGIVNFLSDLDKKDYSRVKIYDNDIRILLELLPNNFFSKIILLFPDPWPKKRHQKRRLFNDTNIVYFLRTLVKDGEIYFGTDIEDYFLKVKNFFVKNKNKYQIQNDGAFNKLPSVISETKYARKSLRKGVLPKYLVVKKKVDIL